MNPKNLTWLSKRCGGWGSSKIAPLGSTKHLPHPSPTKNKLNHQSHCCLLLTFSSATTTHGTVSHATIWQFLKILWPKAQLASPSHSFWENYPINPYPIKTYLSDIYKTYAPLNFSSQKKTYLTGCSNTIHILLINESRLTTLERFKKSTCEEVKVETLRWPGGGVDMINENHGVVLTNNQKNVQKKQVTVSDWKKNVELWNTKSHQVIYSCTNTSRVLNILAQRFGT